MNDQQKIWELEDEIRRLRRRIAELESKADQPPEFTDAHQEIERVAAHYGVDPSVIKGRSRTKSAVFVRSQAALAVRRLGYSFSEMGQMFGGRDHTTMMNLVRKAEREAA
jgi:chromosomal replication initiator protein